MKDTAHKSSKLIRYRLSENVNDLVRTFAEIQGQLIQEYGLNKREWKNLSYVLMEGILHFFRVDKNQGAKSQLELRIQVLSPYQIGLEVRRNKVESHPMEGVSAGFGLIYRGPDTPKITWIPSMNKRIDCQQTDSSVQVRFNLETPLLGAALQNN